MGIQKGINGFHVSVSLILMQIIHVLPQSYFSVKCCWPNLLLCL